MKTFVLSTLIAVAATGNTLAGTIGIPHVKRIEMTELTENATRIDAFKSQLAFHQRNVNVLWNQYELAVDRIHNSRGNHAELDRDKAFFIGVYQQDIQNGIRVEGSQQAIAEIEARYEQAHLDRDIQEAKQLVRLQTQLKVELTKEMKAFEKAKRKNTALADAETLRLLQEVEHYLVQSVKRADDLIANGGATAVAAR
ncbi:hypothetical protein [Parapedobacter koreensis]|uniref:Uncharacterized protein n=1 Tax=Parapedobacter koreensis TaxID=332977 RepID=A0A1H7QNS3_9SPHI|nr:hypothetical protein [Parapedobacter koreensis]SEL49255.1 hypothetical protein SAMN05421740_10614 [Parapedobacter koreensis]